MGNLGLSGWGRTLSLASVRTRDLPIGIITQTRTPHLRCIFGPSATWTSLSLPTIAPAIGID